MNGKWLSIQEYANFKNKSISTVRRYVKSGKVITKDDNGKYFIFVENFVPQTKNESAPELTKKLNELMAENQRLKNEIHEAMMLIELYEQGRFLPPSNPSPEVTL